MESSSGEGDAKRNNVLPSLLKRGDKDNCSLVSDCAQCLTGSSSGKGVANRLLPSLLARKDEENNAVESASGEGVANDLLPLALADEVNAASVGEGLVSLDTKDQHLKGCQPD